MTPTLRHRAEYLAFRLVVCLVECLPVRLSVRAAQGLAWTLCTLLPRKVTRFPVAAENLRRAFGAELTDRELRPIVQRMWTHLFRVVVELIQARRKLQLGSYRQVADFVGLQETHRALLSGRPILVLSGHFGNWEIANALFGLWGFPQGVVAREMDNPLLNDWFRRYREWYGHRLLLKKGDFDGMLELLGRGGSIALLGDQDAGSRGVFVDFFKHPASTFKSIALLALEYDALILVGAAIRQSDDFHEHHWARFTLHGEAVIDPRELATNDPVGEITQAYTSAIERLVRRAPEQYFWVHRRWKSEPRKRQRTAAAA